MNAEQRASWERRWEAEPGLRPEGLEWHCAWGVWMDTEYGHAWFNMPDTVAEFLILASAVRWLCDRDRQGGAGQPLTIRQSAVAWLIAGDWPTISVHGDTLLEALGAACDAVLAARKEK